MLRISRLFSLHCRPTSTVSSGYPAFNKCRRNLSEDSTVRDSVHRGSRESHGQSQRWRRRNIGTRNNNLRFADDIDIIAENKSTLERTVHSLHKDAMRYGMVMNADKTKTMVFGDKQISNKICIDGIELKKCGEIHLDLAIDEFSHHEANEPVVANRHERWIRNLFKITLQLSAFTCKRTGKSVRRFLIFTALLCTPCISSVQFLYHLPVIKNFNLLCQNADFTVSQSTTCYTTESEPQRRVSQYNKSTSPESRCG